MQTAGLAGAAQVLQSRGRGDDSILVHMTPREVGGLQSLALASGGSLTINPDTGLPEAGWLGDLLPTILGVAGTFIGIPPMVTAALVGGGMGIIKGDLKEGLMAGLGAYTGASISSGISASGGLSNMFGKGTEAAATSLGGTGATSLGGTVPAGTAVTDATMRKGLAAAGHAVPATPATSVWGGGGIDTIGQRAKQLWSGTPTNESNVLRNIRAAAVGETDPAKIAAYGVDEFASIPGMAMTGSLLDTATRVEESLQPSYDYGSWGDDEEDEGPLYEGPYSPPRRRYIPRTPRPQLAGATPPLGRDSSEHTWLGPEINPMPGAVASNPLPASSYSIFTPEEQRLFDDPNRINDLRRNPRDPRGWYADGGRVPRRSSSEHQWFDNVNPMPGAVASNPLPVGAVASAPLPVAGLSRPNILSAERDYGFEDLSRNMPRGTGVSPTAQRYIESLDSPPAGQFGVVYRGGASSNNYSGRPSILGVGKRPWGFSDFAAGGVNLPDGAFVMDARTVSELGNGSSGAGQEMLAELGGIPIRGSGDGVSDTIRANVGGTQDARVSRGEVKFNPRAVARIGEGSHARGTDRLYNLMDRARQARRSTRRGASNGLGGLA